MNPRNVLVVFYSRSGTTRVVADLVAVGLDADLEELRDVRDRKGPLGWLRSCYEAVTGRRAEIAPQRRDPAHYDLVVIGTPVWVSHVSSPVRTWLEANVARLPPVALFATMGGRGGDRVLAEMTALVGKAPRATLVATAEQVWGSAMVAQVADFMRTIEQSAPTRPPPPMQVQQQAHAH